MKKLLLTPLLTVLSLTVAAQEVVSTHYTVSTITIDEGEAKESDFNFDFPFKPTKKSKTPKYPHVDVGVLDDLCMGFVGTANADVMPRNSMGRSFEIFSDRLVHFAYTPFSKGPKFMIGFGLGWKNLHSSSPFVYTNLGDDWKEKIAVERAPEGAKEVSSHVHMFNFMFPFIIQQKLTKDTRLELGAIMVVPSHACLKNKYTLNNSEITQKWDTAVLRPINWDFIATLSYDGVGVYAKYSPFNLYRPNCGPHTTTLSIGVILQ